MKLSMDDAELFYKLYHSLLFYANKKFGIIKGINSPENFRKFPIEEISKIRDKLYSQPAIIESFVGENPLNFSPNELKVISSWKNFVKGKFIIFRYTKEYAVFLDTDEPPKAYGVLALNTPFGELIGPYLPVMVDAVLLPFNDKIIYDGIFTSYSITFGGGVRRSFNDAYQQAKSGFGIITSLPLSPEKMREQTAAEKLIFYLRSERNREMYWEEIARLIKKDTELLTLYHQEMGKIHARNYRKRLREIGLSAGWFALLDGITIASGATKGEVERIIQNILPTDKRKFVYTFQLKE